MFQARHRTLWKTGDLESGSCHLSCKEQSSSQHQEGKLRLRAYGNLSGRIGIKTDQTSPVAHNNPWQATCEDAVSIPVRYELIQVW